MIEQGVEALTIEAYVRYLAPCGFDDELRIHTRVTHMRGARFRFEYVLERLNEPQAKIAEGWTGHACVDATSLRPTRMPSWLAEGIADVERTSPSQDENLSR
jgi:acyl-CoA thioesterase FadM